MARGLQSANRSVSKRITISVFVDGEPPSQLLAPAASLTCSEGLWFMGAVGWKLNRSIYILPSSSNLSTELVLNTRGRRSIVAMLTVAKE